MKVKLQFTNIENTIQMIIDERDRLIEELFQAGKEEIELAQTLKEQTARTSVEIRNNLGKVTEGFVNAAVDSNEELGMLKVKHGKAALKVSCIRAELDGVHETRRMFTVWMEGQNASRARG